MKKTILLSAVAALCATSVAATSAKFDQPMAKVEASRVTRCGKAMPDGYWMRVCTCLICKALLCKGTKFC